MFDTKLGPFVAWPGLDENDGNKTADVLTGNECLTTLQ